MKNCLVLPAIVLACALSAYADESNDTGFSLSDASEKRLENAVETDELVKRDGIFFKKFSNLPFDGWVKQVFGRDQVVVGQMLSGGRVGLWVAWHENGQKRSEVHYKDGNKNGPWTEWYENGRKKEEGHYKDGRKDGPWASWYGLGRKRSAVHWRDGVEDGLWAGWYENGQKKSEGRFKDGVEDGPWVFYDEDGTEEKREQEKEPRRAKKIP